MNNIQITFVPKDCDSNLRDQLSKYGSMDDIIYFLLIPAEEMIILSDGKFLPGNIYIEYLLADNYKSIWTIGEINGFRVGIGYAYHS